VEPKAQAANRLDADDSSELVVKQTRFECDRSQLPADLASRFLPLSLDLEGEAFVASALRRSPARWKRWAARCLSPFASDFDVSAVLSAHRLFLLSTPQLLQLLPALCESRAAHWLDVGAGNGDVSCRLLPLAETLTCTEVSRGARYRLGRRGLGCEAFDIATSAGAEAAARLGPFDCLSCFNVLDRCPRPRQLLGNMARLVKPGGALLLSVPLPLDPFYFDGGSTLPPEQSLGAATESFEEALAQLWEAIAPCGLTLSSVSRIPYFSTTLEDAQPLCALDCALWLLRRPSPQARC